MNSGRSMECRPRAGSMAAPDKAALQVFVKLS